MEKKQREEHAHKFNLCVELGATEALPDSMCFDSGTEIFTYTDGEDTVAVGNNTKLIF